MNLKEYKEKLFTDPRFREEQKVCLVCGQNVEDRIITIYAGMIDVLYELYKWCGQNRRHEFMRKEINHLIPKVEYTRFADFVKCSGGIMYRPEDDDGRMSNGLYGMNMARAREFFSGQRDMPMQVRLNQLTGEKEVLKYSKVGDFPRITALLNEKGLYDYERLL